MSRIKNKQIEVTSDFDINSQKLTNLADPVNDGDAVNKKYLDDLAGEGGVIGEAEDGDYSDGLFKDLTATTEIGVPIDRFNEVLGALAPPPAPNLTDWSAALTTDVTGNLSFDSTYVIAGYANADDDQGGVNPGISRDETWSIGTKKLGIKAAAANNDITGTLNYQVPADTGVPNASYPADTFGDADQGNLILYVNGVEVSNVDLTSSGFIDNTSGNTISGFTLGLETAIKFPSGTSLDLFKYRAGSYLVVADDAEIQNGYNWIVVVHDLGLSQRTLARWAFIVDDDTTLTAFSANSLSILSMTGSKFLSGVEYYTDGTADYAITISNAYKNTYSTSATAISFTEGNGSIPSQAIPPLGAEANNDVDITLAKTFTISSNIRLIDDQISASTSVLRTVQATQTSSVTSIANILLDDVNSSSTNTSDDFNAESFRLQSWQPYDLYSEIGSNGWDSTKSLTTDLGYDIGLQTIGGELVYPGNSIYPGNFSTISNGPAGNPDYSAATGEREYIRYFRQTLPTTALFVMNVQGTGGTFVPLTTALTGNNIHVYVKAPGNTAAETGWLDAYENFATAQWVDGDGARNSGLGAGRAFNTNWGLDIGSKSTSSTDGYMIVKIAVGPAFTGRFSGITLTYS